MANPAPTINQINAFNATQGTIIDFNIIGGTELVRSNRIYIYDLSDNSLICTHLYVSTESIHELPANTDSSIVYESGKSSADFVNGAQYYAQIQTYTDTAGTEGGSGLSVAKMFWCLVDPTLTITTIPSTISTTSYNVSATYNANTSVVSNIIQQYQFRLYSATGSLLQSSGVVVGSGEQQGTSTTYGISYNFTGLSVGSSYYVVVDVTTTQGMSVSTQSNTFTVSVDTPTLGEATVVNNACDGYISVTSNLSSEYGGSASGEIASFVTDSVNNVSSLKVSLAPIQDLHGYDKPWSGGAGKNKLHATLTDAKANNVTAAGWTWNGNVATKSGVSFTVQTDDNDNVLSITVNGTNTGTANLYFTLYDITNSTGAFNGMILNGCPSGGGHNSYGLLLTNVSTRAVYDHGSGVTIDNDDSGKVRVQIVVISNYTANNLVFKPMIRLASETDATFAPYTNICPISGWDEVETVVGSGQLIDTSTNQNGAIDANGNEVANATFTRTDFIPIDKAKICINTTLTSGYVIRVHGYSASKAWVQQIKAITTDGTNMLVEEGVPSGIAYVRVSYPLVGVDNTELWQADTYTTDLPQTVYGGTLDVVSGELAVDRGYVDLSQQSWRYQSAWGSWYTDYFADMKGTNTWVETPNFISDRFEAIATNYGLTPQDFSGITSTTRGSLGCRILVKNGSTTEPPIGQLCYELATPTNIQCDPQTVQTLMGDNNVWGDGVVSVTYNIPITNLLVKRQDVADVSGTWLTLYSQPITQASDMDFTFIDFLNQYGKTYKYALVPLLTQTQSGVEVEVEGGYTVSDEVQSIFDGVFISDQTGSQKCKANVGYGDVDMNQAVGTITPIGAKYPVVITNSKNQYHNGSISGTIVPDDYYFNGNLSRIDMVNKRNELEQFLTNKRAKIIKDWNSNIWLVMIMENINCSFNNEYGMGLVNFNANWIEVGDPTNQQDLQAAGLIDVGGA